MQPDHWRRLKQLFDAVHEIPVGERSAWLARECTDAAIVEQVERMLRADADDRLESPAIEWFDSDATRLIGARVGPWHIDRLIARGGMADVYRASGDDPSDQVAIKVLKSGLTATDAARRFKVEGRTLAAFRHPNIVRLLGAHHTAENLPCLAMEYVEGSAIDSDCSSRSLRSIVALFARVCAAVHYAHRNLVVHRDLKPHNILVTADGTPKVLDFGIAKLLSPADDATTAQVAPMTPRYASPEQRENRPISTASDVYSLGVILGELIERFDLRPKHDLRVIVTTATRGDPDERHVSAEALADDLDRYLRNEPIRSRQRSLPHRFAKFVTRNRWSVACSAALLIALLATLGLLYGQWRRTLDAEGLAWRAHGQALQVSQFFRRVILAGDPTTFAADPALVTALEAEAQRVTELEQYPEAESRVRMSIARWYAHLGRWADALPHAEIAVRLAERDVGFDRREVTAMREFAATVRERAGS